MDEVRKVFKAELEHQILLSSQEERIKDIENDAADAMDDDNQNTVCFKFVGYEKSKFSRIIN